MLSPVICLKVYSRVVSCYCGNEYHNVVACLLPKIVILFPVTLLTLKCHFRYSYKLLMFTITLLQMLYYCLHFSKCLFYSRIPAHILYFHTLNPLPTLPLSPRLFSSFHYHPHSHFPTPLQLPFPLNIGSHCIS